MVMSKSFTPTLLNSKNKLVVYKDPQAVIDDWAFFIEGLGEMLVPQAAKGAVTEETYLKLILEVVRRGFGFGWVSKITDCNGRNLGYAVVFDNTEPFCAKSAMGYAMYSNKLCPTTSRELVFHAERWATANGFKQLHACSRRFSGAAFRLFEGHWGFRRACVVFSKDLG